MTMNTKLAALAFVAALATSGCAHMSTTEQRMLSGAGIGALGGAAIGAAAGGSVATGAAIGAAAGAATGYIVDRNRR